MTPDIPRRLDEVRSQHIAAQIKSNRHQPFVDAYQGLPHLETEGYYVQGFLVIAGDPAMLQEHAWLETEAAIVDPSVIHFKGATSALHYFPAQRLSQMELQRAIETAKEDYPEDDPLPVYGKGPYAYYGDVMLGGKDYEQAYQLAQTFTQLLGQQGSQN